MRFGAKIGLVLLAVGVLPVAIAGAVAGAAARAQLESTVGAMQARGASDLALHVERFLAGAEESLRLSAAPLRQLDAFAPAELTRLLALPYRQLPFVSMVAVTDDARHPVAGPVFARRPEGDPDLVGRPPVSDDDLERFARRVPEAPPREGAVRASAPYRGSRGPVRVAAALRLGPNRALVAEFFLAEVEQLVAQVSSDGAVAWLVDADGELVVHGDDAPVLAADERALARDGLGSARPLTRVVSRADGSTWLASFAPVNAPSWGVVLARPTDSAFGAAELVRRRTAAGAVGAVVLALLIGWVVARRVTRRVERLSQAAGAIAQGEIGRASCRERVFSSV